LSYLKELDRLWQNKKSPREQQSQPPEVPREITLEIERGNRWCFLERRTHRDFTRHDWYEWKLYVRPSPSSSEHADVLDRIEVRLEEEWFPRQSPIRQSGASFEYSASGWGSINTTITLVLKKGWRFKIGNSIGSNRATFEYPLAWPATRTFHGESEAGSETFKIVQTS
jgi:hypothetical protein